MMRIVFFDRERETYCAVENVVRILNCAEKYNRRYTNLWRLYLDNGETADFPQKWYSIYRIDV